MRKAFDTNVPKLRPRLKSAVMTEESSVATEMELEPHAELQGEPAASSSAFELEAPASPAVTSLEVAQPELPAEIAHAQAPIAAAPPPPSAPEPMAAAEPKLAAAVKPVAEAVPAPAVSSPLAFDESPDVQSRRERLLKIKRKVAAAARPVAPMPVLPETPARAGESALSLVRDLEGQLQRSRELESTLRADLDQARTELARGAAEARRAQERLAAVERQVEEKRNVLEEMLAEMGALEEERDGAVARAQALTALDEERQTLLDSLSLRVDESEKKRAEAEGEASRLGTELQDRAADLARLRAALHQVTRERDDLAREAAETRRERDELQEARKALEQVHEALATARTRLS